MNTLNSFGISFVYFPFLQEHLEDSIRFNFPDSHIQISPKINAKDLYAEITDCIVKMPNVDDPMILISDPENTIGYPSEMLAGNMMSFYGFFIDEASELICNFNNQNYPKIYYHQSNRSNSTIRFHKLDGSDIRFRVGDEEPEVSPEDNADREEVKILSAEIQSRINKLYALGVNEALIRQIVALPKPKLSPLVITDDFRIVLPEYNNLEIQISNLPKALYFLYLRHTEGMLFKELCHYRDELSEIYRTISPLEDIARMEQSIDDIVDSTKNSVNVNCSRIKTAFASQFRDELASQYYISGRARKPKCIVLDRSLVEDQSGLIMKQ